MEITLTRLEEALNNNEFYIEYQPIMDLKTVDCVGAEALIRWQVEGEQISPARFIPVAENTPLSGLLTYWVIEQIAIELLDWLKATDDVYISFNVPPEILGRGGIRYAAEKSGLLEIKDKIVIEITERGVPDRLGIESLVDREKYGVKLCLDDVGTKAENLVLYSRLDIDIIKLDKIYADEMLTPDWIPKRIMGITALAHSTEINIIAEGIETEHQLEIFRKAGITMGQGWFFSKALSAVDFKLFHASSHPQIN